MLTWAGLLRAAWIARVKSCLNRLEGVITTHRQVENQAGRQCPGQEAARPGRRQCLGGVEQRGQEDGEQERKPVPALGTEGVVQPNMEIEHAGRKQEVAIEDR